MFQEISNKRQPMLSISCYNNKTSMTVRLSVRALEALNNIMPNHTKVQIMYDPDTKRFALKPILKEGGKRSRFLGFTVIARCLNIPFKNYHNIPLNYETGILTFKL